MYQQASGEDWRPYVVLGIFSGLLLVPPMVRLTGLLVLTERGGRTGQ
jgi:hypothetical protein